MIAPMQKIAVIASARDADALVQRLFEAGVVHVASAPQEAGAADLAAAKAQLDAIDQAISVLASARGKEPLPAARALRLDEAAAIAENVRAFAAAAAEADRARAAVESEIQAQQPFGDFDPAAVAALQKSGVHVALLTFPKGSTPELPEDASLHALSEASGMVAAAVLSRSPVSQDLRPSALPVRRLSAAIADRDAHTAMIAKSQASLRALSADLPSLRAARSGAKERLDWQSTRASLAQQGPVVVLEGFVPEAMMEGLREDLEGEPVALLTSTPAADDVVPTKLVGPRWVEQVHTVFQGIGIVPGYSEADVSSWFLVFLVLFASMLIGDGGYGAIVVVGALLAWRKTRHRPSGAPQAVRLALTLGLGTLAWGAITGTWFAIFQPEQLPAALEAMRIDWLAPIGDKGKADPIAATKHIMLLCFVLGAMHLTLAHGWAAIRCGKTPQALAQLGWIGSTWLMFFLARSMVLGESMPGYVTTLAWVSIAAIALFMTPPKAIKNEWFNHVMLPLSLVSNFVDVVSYLRLFAVGSAGVAVAQSFNTMAMGAAKDGGAGYVTAAFIAVFGHTLNLLLAAMAVLVHGVRLNTLEFSAHLGLQWSGVPYRPFGRSAAASSEDRANSQTNLVEE
jgi:V/A-type H+/Na+-transporting ATPase subunit I